MTTKLTDLVRRDAGALSGGARSIPGTQAGLDQLALAGDMAMLTMSEEEAAMMEQLSQTGELNPDAFSQIFDALYREVEQRYPTKTGIIRARIAKTLNLPADEPAQSMFSRFVQWGEEHKGLMIAILSIVAVAIGTAAFWVWWKKHKAADTALGDAVREVDSAIGTDLDAVIAAYASRTGGDGDPSLVWGKPHNKSDAKMQRRAFDMIDLLRSVFGDTDTARSVLLAIRTLELEHFDDYEDIHGGGRRRG